MDLHKTLAELGWSQAQLARKLDVRPNTVGEWKTHGVPGYAQAYLRAALGAKAHWDWFNDE